MTHSHEEAIELADAAALGAVTDGAGWSWPTFTWKSTAYENALKSEKAARAADFLGFIGQLDPEFLGPEGEAARQRLGAEAGQAEQQVASDREAALVPALQHPLSGRHRVPTVAPTCGSSLTRPERSRK
jgi:hypothetical protein